MIVNGFGGQGKFAIDENYYDDLFVVTIDGSGPRIVRIEFGTATKSD